MLDQRMPFACGPRSTWTCGRIALDPGAASIIPGRAEILFQFRDVEEPVLHRMEATLRACIQESNRREKCPAVLEALIQRGATGRAPGLGARLLATRAPRLLPSQLGGGSSHTFHR